MKNSTFKLMFTAFLFLSYTIIAKSAPWYTGPLLAPAGKTIPLGHYNFELYGFDTTRSYIFNNQGKKERVPFLQSLQANPIFTYGLANGVDVQLSIPFTKINSEGISGESIGDASVTLGFQAHTQQPNSRIPNLRLTLQESFDTGKFDGLNPTNKGITATGSGGYETIFGAIFQDLMPITDINYLRTRLAFAYLFALSRGIEGVSGFGGSPDTKGTINPGNLYNIDLAGEFSVTQHWVAVMEMYYVHRGNTTFKGNPGHDVKGDLIPKLDQISFHALSVAPAIEYNFSEHYGLIGGVWFAVEGKNTPVFTSGVIALNIFW